MLPLQSYGRDHSPDVSARLVDRFTFFVAFRYLFFPHEVDSAFVFLNNQKTIQDAGWHCIKHAEDTGIVILIPLNEHSSV